MVWRATPEERKRTDGASRKAFMKKRIDGGTPVGILGYQDERPVAWCSIAPKTTYRNLTGAGSPPGDARTWSIACFFVRREHRNRGLTGKLIEAAIGYARSKGARSIEAYPVDDHSPSYRFMGYVKTFTALGFREVGMAGKRRHIMVFDLPAALGRTAHSRRREVIRR
jgi:GNAT superfamily N-acetyltransferase